MADSSSFIVLFTYAGKPVIGNLYSSIPGAWLANGTVMNKVIGSSGNTNNYYAVSNPCYIEYTLEKTTTGSARLKWKIIPFIYNKVIKNPSEANFLLPKADVAISNSSGEDKIDPALMKAYKEICTIV